MLRNSFLSWITAAHAQTRIGAVVYSQQVSMTRQSGPSKKLQALSWKGSNFRNR
jgi:hypothetical protein